MQSHGGRFQHIVDRISPSPTNGYKRYEGQRHLTWLAIKNVINNCRMHIYLKNTWKSDNRHLLQIYNTSKNILVHIATLNIFEILGKLMIKFSDHGAN